jgi:REP element-mobilizing transposase RayT
MARQWRIEYPGARYHVLSRGNGRQDIFLTDDDRGLFIELLKESSERFNIEVYAYVLMGNHYHLLLKTPDANLSKGMQWVGTAYTRKFNLLNNQSGHLFQGRFKSIIVENDAYLLRLSCYIHRNPLRAGIVNRLCDYKWSSYPYYAYRKGAPGWLNTSLILEQVGGKDKKQAYRRKVQQYADEKGSVWEDVRHGFVYGSETFINDLKERFLSNQKDVELPQHNRMYRDVDPKIILETACEAMQIDLNGVRNSKRISKALKDKRDLLIYLLWQSGRFSNQQIGTLLGISYSNVSRRIMEIRKKLDKDKGVRGRYKDLSALVKV